MEFVRTYRQQLVPGATKKNQYTLELKKAMKAIKQGIIRKIEIIVVTVMVITRFRITFLEGS